MELNLIHSHRPENTHWNFGLVSLANLFPEDAVMAEIGIFEGESTSIFLPKVKKIYCVDPWCDVLSFETKQDIGGSWCFEDVYNSFMRRLGNNEKLVVLRMASVKAAEVVDEPLDVVYIDGDHRYEGVKSDILAWMPKIKEGGILSGHDYRQRDGVRQAVNELLKDKEIKFFKDDSWMVYV